MPTRFLRNLVASDRERFLETLLRSATDFAIITLDSAGDLTGWNAGAEAILGWSELEVLGEPAALIFTPEDRLEGIPELEMSTAQAAGSAADERWHLRRDGSRFWASGSMMPLLGEGGYVKILRDHTVERERQAQAKAQNVRLHVLAEAASELISGHDPDTVIRASARSLRDGLGVDVCLQFAGNDRSGFQLEVMVGVEGDSLDDELLAAAIRGVVNVSGPRYLVSVQASDDPQDGFIRRLGLRSYASYPLVAAGHQLGALSFGSRIRDSFDGEDLALFEAIAHHIAVVKERQRAERSLRETEDRLSMAVEATGIGTFEYDPVTRRGLWDSQAKTLFGLPPDAEIHYEATFLAGIHPEDRLRVHNAIQDVLDPEGTGSYEAEFRVIRQDDGSTRWIAARGTTQVAGVQTIRFVGTAWDITRRRQAEEALEQRVERYHLVTRATNDVIWDWDLEQNHVLWNEALQTAFGHESAKIEPTGEWWINHIHPDDRQRVEDDVRSAIQGDQSEWSHEYRFLRADGSYADVLDRGYMVRSLTGAPKRMIGAMLDITQRKQAEQRLRLVHQELGHRLRNVLTMVQAIASQTLRNAPSMEEARDTLAARLVTMGKAQDVLIAGAMEVADIGAVLDAALEAHGGRESSRLRLRGPAVKLNPGPALSLALLVHELATNATKYGALSVEGGHIDLVWTITDDHPACLALRWSEHGGPRVVEPTRRGFGSRLITLGLGGETGGSVKLQYDPTGVVCTLTAPLSGLVAASSGMDRSGVERAIM